MRTWLCRILAWTLAVGLGAAWCAADEAGVAARHHAWARFQPGAWKLVRVVTETLDERGLVMSTSVTETKTTLQKVTATGVGLEVEVGVEVAGKQFDGQPQGITQGFHGELAGAEVKVKPPVAAQVTIEDQKIDCQRQEIEWTGPGGTTVTTVYYSDVLPPYIVKRESTTTDPTGQTSLGESTMEVIALDMPFRVLSTVKNTACIRTLQKNAKGTITSLALSAAEVPGGVVFQSSKETDKAGRLVRRSTLELVAYGLQTEEERIGLFGRKRAARRKPVHPGYPP